MKLSWELHNAIARKYLFEKRNRDIWFLGQLGPIHLEMKDRSFIETNPFSVAILKRFRIESYMDQLKKRAIPLAPELTW